VLCVTFDVIGAYGSTSSLDLELTSLFQAGTFDDLLALAIVNDSSVEVIPACTYGDVNDDGSINSGDALIVLSNEISLPLPPVITARLDVGCGDVNGDAATDSTDANVILSSEVGLPINPAFPIGNSNQTFDDCNACGGKGMTSRAVDLPAEPVIIKPQIFAHLGFSTKSVLPGGLFETWVVVDPRRSGLALGSYTGRLTWDAQYAELVGAYGGEGFAAPLTHLLEPGQLKFTQADPFGTTVRAKLMRVQLRALRPLREPSSIFKLDFSAMASTGPDFDDLTPQLRVRRSRWIAFSF
jgi:hypothetical protein